MSTIISHNYIGGCYPPSQAQVGTVFFDSGTQTLKVWDGTTWIDVTPVVQVDLDIESSDALDWAIDRIKDETQINKLADKYPMVAAALGELEVVLKIHQNLENDE